MLIVLGVCFAAMVFKIFSMVGEQEDRIDELCDRLTKLEQDAVKIRFDDKNK
jgi:hypothetical protein